MLVVRCAAARPTPQLPEPPPAEATPEPTIPNPVVLIDPGHGGGDGGAVRGGTNEKDINLAVALRLRDALAKSGLVDVVMTRDSDIHVSLAGRVAIINSARPALQVSIHANSFDLAYVRGVETFYRSDSQESMAFAQLLHNAVLKSYKDTGHETIDRDIRPGSFRILTRPADKRSVLLELGYLSNREDRRILTDPLFQVALAENLAQTIIEIVTQGP